MLQDVATKTKTKTKTKKKKSITTFLKRGYRLEKHGYRMIWPIAMFF